LVELNCINSPIVAGLSSLPQKRVTGTSRQWVSGFFNGMARQSGSGSGVIKSMTSKSLFEMFSTVAEPEVESGPQLSKKKRKTVDTFVKKMGGKRTIQRVLIANNGMAATKAIMSMRQWAYVHLGDERAIEFVALATRDDLNANAEFIRLADSFVEVPSGSNKVRTAAASRFSVVNFINNPPPPPLTFINRITMPMLI